MTPPLLSCTRKRRQIPGMVWVIYPLAFLCAGLWLVADGVVWVGERMTAWRNRD